jgi:hypothetical protein
MESKIDPSNLEPKVKKTSETTWIIQLEEDPETGDLIMPLPQELIEAQGWAIGDTLTWDVDPTNSALSLTKNENSKKS